MTHEMPPFTETTPAGLRSLIDHIEAAAAAGLDPEFVRKLGKRIAKELEEMKATKLCSDSELAGLEASVVALTHAADSKDGARLTRSLQRLREHEGPAGEGKPN
ncbi:hypothetical protein [Cupriavidus necator]|uniref:hypothetical protein n=1 Tax=Cupriavidus necator TaxID=106590 RepID=UPI0005B40E5D|nr:hypothetical protein [Cupriavidus necator]